MDISGRMAIVGMGAYFGACNELDAFAHTAYAARQHIIPLPEGRKQDLEAYRDMLDSCGFTAEALPRGAYIAAAEIDWADLPRFGLRPPVDSPAPQGLLLLKVVDAALRDAGIAEGSRVALLLVAGSELAPGQPVADAFASYIQMHLERLRALLPSGETAELATTDGPGLSSGASFNHYGRVVGQVVASGIATGWKLSGPAAVLAAEGGAVVRALQEARRMLMAGEVEAVVIGAMDMADGVAHLLAGGPAAHSDAPTLSYDQRVHGWLAGEGAGAVVLKRYERARQAGNRVYAVLDAIGLVQSAAASALPGPSAAAVALACQQSHAAAGITAADVGYLEVHASGIAAEDEAEINGLLQSYRTDDGTLTCALGSAKTSIGHTFAAAAMASLIKTALCLYQRYIPGTPGWSGPKGGDWQHSPFYVPPESRPWFHSASRPPRIAAISSLSADGSHAHLIVSADPVQHERTSSYLRQMPLQLFPLAADDEQALLAQLDELERSIQAGTALATAAYQCFAAWRSREQAAYALALVAQNATDLLREIERARAGVAQSFRSGEEWKTPPGSCFTARPLGRQGKIAFVYPGAFNAYVGLGQHVFQLFPVLYDRFGTISSDMGRVLGEKLLYPRSMQHLSADDLRQREAHLVEESINMLGIGTSFAVLYTLIMRDYFRVQPAIAFGYSQGEVAMIHALGIWTNSDQANRLLHESNLYQDRLSGRKNAVREFWGGESSSGNDDLWANYVLMASPEQVLPHLQGEPHVYLAIVNTPTEVTLAGDPAACKRVIGKVKCRSLRAPFNHVIHSPPVQSEYGELVRINTADVQHIPDIQFYSAAQYAPIEVTKEAIAHSIAQMCCQPLDFPRLIQRVYEDGARIFIELGPARNCARWIEATLEGQPHAALFINKKGVDDYTSIVRVLARLVAHRAPLDLTVLYERHSLELEASQVAVAAAGQAEEVQEVCAPIPAAVSEQVLETYRLQQQALRQSTTLATTSHTSFLHSRSGALQQLDALIQQYMTTMLHALDEAGYPGSALPVWTASEETSGTTNGTAGPERAANGYQSLATMPPAPPLAAPAARAPVPGPIWDAADLLEFAGGRIGQVFGADYAIIDSYRRRVRLPLPPYLLVSRVTQLEAERGVFKPCRITTEYDIPEQAWYCVDHQVPWAVAIESGQCDLLLISYLGIDFECRGERVYRLLDGTLTFLGDLPREGETLRYDIRINSFARSGDTLLFFFSYDCFVADRPVLKMTGGCAGFFTDEQLASGRGVVPTDKELAARRTAQQRHFAPPLVCQKTSFTEHDLLALSAGDRAACLGPQYDQGGNNRSLRLPPRTLLMIDRVVSVAPQGGPWRLGLIVAEKDLAPDQWYFPCHFQDDQVLAGSLLAEGCVQLMQFYMLFCGLQKQTRQARFQPAVGLAQTVVCRGQVTPADSKLTYRLEITDIGLEPEPYAIGNIDVIVADKIVARFTNLGVRLAETAPPALPEELPAPQAAVAPAPVRAALFDEEHVREFTVGSAAACFGPDFNIYEQRRTPRTPNGDLQMMSRVIHIDGQPHDLKADTLLVSEYDVPADAWFYEQNAYPTLPYSVVMEIAMQPCGFLSAYLRSCLLFPEADLYFRNLDGQGRVLKQMDLRGRTITNHARLLSSTSIQGIIIQKFHFRLSCAGEDFYEGGAVFGYFTPEALINQVGLDGGKLVPAWYEQGGQPTLRAAMINLHAPATRQRFYQPPAGKPHYCLSRGHLDFLDQVMLFEQGGTHQQGYLYASKRMNPDDWFFACHFKDDPVMPGSLGIEAIIQALQLYALQRDLGQQFRSPHFDYVPGHEVSWKYRGQIVREVRQWALEVHITDVRISAEQVVIVANASVWREKLRIYEIKQIAIRIAES